MKAATAIPPTAGCARASPASSPGPAAGRPARRRPPERAASRNATSAPRDAGLCGACSLLLALAVPAPAQAEDSELRRGGDLLRGLLPLAALVVTVRKSDHEGMQQLGLTLAASELTTEGLKRLFNHTDWGRRPDGGPYNSFPSGHATTACSSAFFLGERYGWRYGAPALLPAAVVLYSRVDARAHHWRDVIAGCAIGAGFASGLTTTRGTPVHVQLQPLRDGVALSLSLPL